MNGQEILKKGYIARLATPTDRSGAPSRPVLEHSARTALTAVASIISSWLPES